MLLQGKHSDLEDNLLSAGRISPLRFPLLTIYIGYSAKVFFSMGVCILYVDLEWFAFGKQIQLIFYFCLICQNGIELKVEDDFTFFYIFSLCRHSGIFVKEGLCSIVH